MDLWNLVADWLIILVQVHIDNFSIIDSLAPSILSLKKLSTWTWTKNYYNQPISYQISKVQVLLNQIFHNIKTHAIWAQKLLISRYELGPFPSSFMRWPVCYLPPCYQLAACLSTLRFAVYCCHPYSDWFIKIIAENFQTFSSFYNTNVCLNLDFVTVFKRTIIYNNIKNWKIHVNCFKHISLCFNSTLK